MMIILNDNGMSISPNIGGLSKHLLKLRSSKKYLNIKKNIKKKIAPASATAVAFLHQEPEFSLIIETILSSHVHCLHVENPEPSVG